MLNKYSILNNMITYSKEIIVKIDTANKGYEYFIDTNHPLATGNSGRVYLHRHVASITLGRWLTTDEHVHHIDEVKGNNDPDNLVILTNEEHAALHNGTEYHSIVCPICKRTFKVTTSGLLKRVNCSVGCMAKARIKINIDKDLLEKLIWYYPAIVVAKEYGLSDKGIIKKARSMGCLMPPPYFHNKSEKFKQEERLKNNI